MPSPSTTDTWQEHLDQLAAYIDAHGGHFPSPQAADPAQADLATWWLQQTIADLPDADRQRLDLLREHADQLRAGGGWSVQLESVTAYVDTHDGRFPPTWGVGPAVADLGRWWVTQNIRSNHAQLNAAQRAALGGLRRRADTLRAQARERRRAQVLRAASDRARAASRAAGRAGAQAAAEALNSPHLIPGDREVLLLRVENPEASLAELAELAGMSGSRFSTKLYGALRRVPNSAGSQARALPDRVLAPHEAAEFLGVAPVVLGRWSRANLVACQKSRSGHRRYQGAELERIKQVLAQGWPESFTEAALQLSRHAA